MTRITACLFGSLFTDSLPISFLAYSLSSCNRYSGVGALNSHSIPCYSLTISYPQIKHRFTFIFISPKRLTNNSENGGNLFLPSSSFILFGVSLPLIAEVIFLLLFFIDFSFLHLGT
ncbi:hypothetical protein ES288_D11G229400v1 [Gossypium darwinii]|uniref:Uncharacterized protein n=2 Tax=Gossypium TaxID=3633 RepID=A0A5D2IRJ3_GOSTO|nr:hypothetical protein ES288_D11G229400v1 [Gossypium darwinii]TYH44910.1 hypothetical protein ES332_D11G227700v1 [Gossypium tomentosum]